jgi:hypothetical protein
MIKTKVNITDFEILKNKQAKEDKEEWLGQYCEEIENQLNRGNTEKPLNLIRELFGEPK